MEYLVELVREALKTGDCFKVDEYINQFNSQENNSRRIIIRMCYDDDIEKGIYDKPKLVDFFLKSNANPKQHPIPPDCLWYLGDGKSILYSDLDLCEFNTRFGFSSMSQLKNWFDDLVAGVYAIREGLYIKSYLDISLALLEVENVDNKSIKYSESQCIFKITDAKNISYINLTKSIEDFC